MQQKVIYRYKVNADWPRDLWRDYKLDNAVYEEYLYLCRARPPHIRSRPPVAVGAAPPNPTSAGQKFLRSF